ncbi:MAG: signal peptidase I [Oscillospiraceae bacterium]
MREYIRFSKNKSVNFVIGTVLDILSYALTTLFCILMLNIYVFHTAYVQGDSMIPTLQDKDRLLVNALKWNPSCGDIVIVNAQRAGLLDEDGNPYQIEGIHKIIVKRVIGVAGQTLDMDFEHGYVYRNGLLLDESYTNTRTNAPVMDAAFSYPITIPEGYIYVMGDNREVSKDSRYSDVGLIPLSEVEGCVITRITPWKKIGTVN